MQSSESEGPAWNKFWLSMDNESDSMVSGGLSSHQQPNRSVLSPDHTRSQLDNSVLPNESASHNGDEHVFEMADSRLLPVNEDAPFPFKFKAPSGRVHRLNVVTSAGIAGLIANVSAKLGPEVEAVGGEAIFEDGKLSNSGYALSYMDNEGDTVSITTDQDLTDSIHLARQSGRDKVDLFVHDPEKPAVSVTQEPQPMVSKAPTPPESVLRSEEDISEPAAQPKSPAQNFVPQSSTEQQQLINGVPNELILPGAIVTLAAVIAGVFVLSRASNR